MNYTQQIKHRALLLVAAVKALSLISSQMRADTGTCNGASITLPFTDVPSSNVDQSLKRGNQRAAAQQWWQPSNVSVLRSTSFRVAVQGDGPDAAGQFVHRREQ